jgi:hypothetical protein
MGQYIMGNGKKGKEMVSVFKFGQTDRSLKEIGLTIRCMGQENSNTQTVIHSKVSGMRIEPVGMECI